MLDITPITPDFVAEVRGLDLRQALPASLFAEVEAALNRYAVLVLPGQAVNEAQQLAFARCFGPLEVSLGPSLYNAGRPRRLDDAGLSDISNLDETGDLLGKQDLRRLINLSNQLWHTDSSFKRTPASVSILSAQEVVREGGETEFADMRAAWDALPPQQQARLEELVAEHDYFHSRALTGFDAISVPDEWKQRMPPVPQKLVRVHPGSGRKSLYLASHIKRLYGLDDAASRALLDELMSFATLPRFVHQHHWHVDDVVIWDNRCTMHRGRPFDESQRRAMRRATVMDSAPTVPENWRAPAASSHTRAAQDA
ncbi:MAG: TauD/TfdA family dioxygenase [Burkholderiales bacterium]|nr:TauD/TfdA family dioxygenase [Burkholderiales bacterium]